MANNKIFLNLPVWCYLFCFNTIPLSLAATIKNNTHDTFAACNANLEQKFLSNSVKCPHSGLFPVKGSCTVYVPCISFGEDLMKPLKRAECSSGMTFDVEYLRCRPVQKHEKNNCLQRKCYPTETKLEDGAPSSSLSSGGEEKPKDKEDSNASMDDVVEIALDSQEFSNNRTTHCDDKDVVISSAVADRGNLKSLVIPVCFNLFLVISRLAHHAQTP